MTQEIENIRNWLAVSHAPKIGPVKFHSLLEKFHTPKGILDAGRTAWKEAGLTEKTIQSLAAPEWQKVDLALKWAEQENAKILTLESPLYPPLLKGIGDAPAVLYTLGQADVLSQPQIAIVGSRNPSHTGLDTAHDFAAYLANVGMTVTSGMALGIDAAAHQGALVSIRKDDPASGFTIAVTGTGLDRVYPSRHRELAHNIVENGVMISEYAPGTPPLPGNFPRRNRIISGLSMGVLVVEAALQSGSLITARMALDQGREVFAIPGSIHNSLAKGCHSLIRDGAKLVETAEHILEELGGFIALHNENKQKTDKTTNVVKIEPNNDKNELYSEISGDFEYKQVLECIDLEPTSVDKVVERSGLTAEAVCSMLLVLELQGYVTALSGGYYCQSR